MREEDDDEDEEEEEEDNAEKDERRRRLLRLKRWPLRQRKQQRLRRSRRVAADAALEGAAPPRSGPPSSAGIAVPSADDLRKEPFAVYCPDQEPFGQFLSRIGHLVLALKAHKIPVAASDLEKISLKATILSEVYGRIGGDWEPKRLVRV